MSSSGTVTLWPWARHQSRFSLMVSLKLRSRSQQKREKHSSTYPTRPTSTRRLKTLLNMTASHRWSHMTQVLTSSFSQTSGVFLSDEVAPSGRSSIPWKVSSAPLLSRMVPSLAWGRAPLRPSQMVCASILKEDPYRKRFVDTGM